MNKKYLLLAIFILPILLFSTIITVGPIGCDATVIQNAIDLSASGDTIMVYPASGGGVYYEELLISAKGLTLLSATGTNVIIDGSGDNTILIRYTHSYVTIDGFTIRNTGNTAFDCIQVLSGYSPKLTVQNCIFDEGTVFIDVDQASRVYLYDNEFGESNGSSSHFVDITNSICENIISGNTFHNTTSK